MVQFEYQYIEILLPLPYLSFRASLMSAVTIINFTMNLIFCRFSCSDNVIFFSHSDRCYRPASTTQTHDRHRLIPTKFEKRISRISLHLFNGQVDRSDACRLKMQTKKFLF